ncbi:unnamed protein product [Chondrus crispus]|uniref:SAC domain-containing protein n=1 Tax=Chondrus crispus TaxID=2769 RepID=R7QHT2_CHOCR|nr:unnamed protein product [Chondrus crispus]CDF37006.1 unnamed protein product [Chondrus crispus]|eukprot:XP_005716825.1 unnamed protein product [Chondrus crispus]
MTVETLFLRTSPRWITLEPAGAAVSPTHLLYLDRHTLACSLRTKAECAALAEPDTETLVYGLVGLLESLHDAYLLVITKRSSAGAIIEAPVWRVDTLKAIPVRGPKMLKKQIGLTKPQLAEEAMLAAMVNSATSLPGFYFSHAIDLTRSAQQRAEVSRDSHAPATPDFARADLRFVWNRYAAKKVAEQGAISWIVPLILGYVDVRNGLVNGKAVQLALVSRRSPDRPGLRYTARGADVHGNCSNFVETEQIVSHGDSYSSYIQLRGSIPLLWKQEACIKYKPTPVLKEVDAGGKGGLGQMAFEKHLDSLVDHYGPVTLISLIENKGIESILHSALSNAVDMMANPKLHFVPWDFHKKCKGMKYERVDHELLPIIDSDLNAYSYFYTKDGTSASITKRQRGVVRVNCIDSLDRTNVVQSVVAHRIMDAALQVMGVLDSNPETGTAAKFDAFEKAFKNTWADNADALSVVYAGSGALKTDYTRTGKRSKPGMVQDGIRAVQRYFYQNMFDGRRQDGIDLLLGVVVIPKSSTAAKDLSSIMSKAEPLVVKEKFLPHLCLLCLIVAVVGSIVPQSMVIKGSVAAAGLAGAGLFFSMMLAVGHKLVSRPKLDGTN